MTCSHRHHWSMYCNNETVVTHICTIMLISSLDRVLLLSMERTLRAAATETLSFKLDGLIFKPKCDFLWKEHSCSWPQMIMISYMEFCVLCVLLLSLCLIIFSLSFVGVAGSALLQSNPWLCVSFFSTVLQVYHDLTTAFPGTFSHFLSLPPFPE